MTESTVIGNREVPRSPASEGNVITGENASRLQAMAKAQAEEMHNQCLASIHRGKNYIRELEDKVLALQSKLDEIEKQEPLHWVSLSKNFEVWQEVKKDDLYNSTLWTKPIPVYEPIRDLCKASQLAAPERNPNESKLIEILTSTEFRIYTKLDGGGIVKYEDLVGKSLSGWSQELHVNSTIDRRPAMHVSNINKKLKKIGLPQYIKNMRGEGFFLVREGKE